MTADITVQRLLDDQVRALAAEHGPFEPLTVSGYSATSWNQRRTAMFKAYLTFDPAGRAAREAHALDQANELGLSVPQVIATERAESTAWSLLSVVAGEPLSVRDGGEVTAFMETACRALAPVHEQTVPRARSGWTGPEESVSRLLLGQLSGRWEHHSWSRELQAALSSVADSAPRVLLHGDVKADHFLIADEAVSVVDWESCACGPVSLDHADLVFHAFRDLAYGTGGSPDLDEAAAVLNTWGVERAIGILLAWRLVLWADRRRQEDLTRLPVRHLHQLLVTDSLEQALALTWQAILVMRDAGTPR